MNWLGFKRDCEDCCPDGRAAADVESEDLGVDGGEESEAIELLVDLRNFESRAFMSNLGLMLRPDMAIVK